MKRKFGFVLGACIIIGMIDLVTEQVVFATIYNPLNPSEEIVPKDPPEINEPPVDKKAPKTEEPASPKEEPESKENNQKVQPLSNIAKPFLADGKQLAKRVTVEDIFLANSLSVDLAMPDDDSDGDGNDKPSYLTSLCYLFTGSVLYGQKNDGGLKTHVFDIFE
ncbi:hypothetical protein [Enterococcus gallinarum]|uniref:Cell wall surface anchor family protein n=1 Tax=Enterococcus gallinarum TaxID=1353 RepID=A0A5F0V303_ENTGA|nr:hypothetical protein [Enterococcus gallinarum]MBF0820478.1 hypothetical protein [Enterococcus faecalis]MBF0725903.1 hypothetical protein [Enterococcus gallinarum]MBF0797774.1 hypothetical protein [Enterococcus gallinarum]MBX8977273.1 hypothetical protein [Enterococcus gallinarum]MCR1944042.1 hypothetical protein [Enterococcus gallinarum]